MVGRDKLRVDDLDSTLAKYGQDGWELASLALNADLKGREMGTCSSSSVQGPSQRPVRALPVQTDACCPDAARARPKPYGLAAVADSLGDR
jgi:hypothetical protein